MFESVLVADHGLGAARVLRTCQRLGIKAVLAGLSVDTDQIPTDAGPLADDVVLLADLGELSDPTAVVRAARAAGVQAVHPGYGPLRGDARLADAAGAAGVAAIVTTGVGPAHDISTVLGAERPPVSVAGADELPVRWVYVLGTPTSVVVLGSVRIDAHGRTVAGPFPADGAADRDTRAGDREISAAHRLAHAAAAVLGFDGLAAIGIGVGGITAVVPGLPEHHAAWELVTGLDLVEHQFAHALGRLRLRADADIPSTGVAIGRAGAEIVADVRTLAALGGRDDREALRVDAVALAGSGHGALVRVSAWGADRAHAEQVLARYVERRDARAG